MKWVLMVMFTVMSGASLLAQSLFQPSQEEFPADVEEMYIKGTNFLKSTQTEEGQWKDAYGNQPGVVALAVLALLAHGEDPEFGPNSATIKRGISFVLRSTNSATGYIGTSMYNHGFATLLLAEAYGTIRDERIGPALENAVRLILDAQEKNPHAAWRYNPASEDADTTVSGACLMALFAARNAGIKVPDVAVERALKFYQFCQSADGGFGYTGAGNSNVPRTGIGNLMFSLAGKKQSKTWEESYKYLQNSPMPENQYYFYGLYYVSQAFFHGDPSDWEAWNRQNIRQLQAVQRSDGGWDGTHGPTFSTAAALLSLALNYRYLPIYER